TYSRRPPRSWGGNTIVDARVAAFARQDFGSGQGTQTFNFLTGLFSQFLCVQVDPLNPQNSLPDIAGLLDAFEAALASGTDFTTITYVAVNAPPAAGTCIAEQYFSQFLGVRRPSSAELVALAYPNDTHIATAGYMPTFSTLLDQFENGFLVGTVRTRFVCPEE